MQVHREITQLTPEDSFLVFERVKQDFDFPIHFHPDFEMNFIHKGEGVRRVVGDNNVLILTGVFSNFTERSSVNLLTAHLDAP